MACVQLCRFKKAGICGTLGAPELASRGIEVIGCDGHGIGAVEGARSSRVNLQGPDGA